MSFPGSSSGDHSKGRDLSCATPSAYATGTMKHCTSRTQGVESDSTTVSDPPGPRVVLEKLPTQRSRRLATKPLLVQLDVPTSGSQAAPSRRSVTTDDTRESPADSANNPSQRKVLKQPARLATLSGQQNYRSCQTHSPSHPAPTRLPPTTPDSAIAAISSILCQLVAN